MPASVHSTLNISQRDDIAIESKPTQDEPLVGGFQNPRFEQLQVVASGKNIDSSVELALNKSATIKAKLA